MRRQPAAASGYWLVPRAGCWPARSAPEIRPGDPAWSDDVAIAHWLHQTAISL